MDDTWCVVATLCPCGGEKNGFVLNRLETERERERERTERERDKRIEKDGVWKGVVCGVFIELLEFGGLFPFNFFRWEKQNNIDFEFVP